MNGTIDPPDTYGAGESLKQEFTIEEDGTAKDISGATVTWALVYRRGDDRDDAILTDTDTETTVTVIDATAGRIDVTIAQDATTDLGGRRLWQRLIVDDDGDQKQIWGGRIRVDEV